MVGKFVALGLITSIFTAVLMVKTGFYQNIQGLRLAILLLAPTVSMMFLAAVLLWKQAELYRKYRCLYQRVFETGIFQQETEQKLTVLATWAKEAAERILVLQKFGLSGLERCYQEYEFDKARERLEREFKTSQAAFYDVYDLAAAVSEIAYLVLRRRDWKAYAGEPVLPKREVSRL